MNTDISELVNKVIATKRSRRAALKNMGLGAVGLGMLGLLEPKARADAPGHDFGDAEILNFALNLEYLEAQYYSNAAFGTNIQNNTGSVPSASITGTGTYQGAAVGAVTISPNSGPVPFTNSASDVAIKAYAEEIALDEINHVNFLRSALTAAGVGAVPMPNIDLYNSFNTAASAAGIGPSFNPFANSTDFLVGAYIFEDVGVTAYHGAAALLANKGYLTAAAGILGVEAYHAGIVRTLLYQLGSTTQTYTNQISTLRATLAGGTTDDYGVTDGPVATVDGGASLVPTDTNSLVFARSTRQVLNIVYGGVNATSGLFYPNGMNGVIH